jgi:hypothetical protein
VTAVPLDQIGIALTGVTAIFLSQSGRESWRRWACIFGMIGQPFWFYAAITASQWGIVFVNTLYTVAWGKGLLTHWLAPLCRERAERRAMETRIREVFRETFSRHL